MSFLNPDKHDVYLCTEPIRLRVNVPTSPEKDYQVDYYKKTGEAHYVHPSYIHTRSTTAIVPCRHCDNCRRLSARQWQARLSWQARYLSNHCKYSHIYFVSLSFDNAHLPSHLDGDNSIELETYSLVQKFIRQLRDGIKGVYSKLGDIDNGAFTYDYLAPLSFSYYVVGEFGDNRDRFHYHLILFLEDDRLIPDYFYHLPDGSTINQVNEFKYGIKRYPKSIANPEGLPLRLTRINSGYKSPYKKKSKKRLQTGKEATLQYILSQRWKYGIVSVGSADTNGAYGYVSKYATCGLEDYKKGYVPFHRQSIGLASQYFLSWAPSIFTGDTRRMFLDPLQEKYGVVPIPKYYLKKFGDELRRIDFFNNGFDNFTKSLVDKYNNLKIKIKDSFSAWNSSLSLNEQFYEQTENPEFRHSET